MTKRSGVTKRAGCASNLTRFITLVTKRAVVTKRAATGGMEVGEAGERYTYRYTVTTRMIPALRWAAMRAILMFQ